MTSTQTLTEWLSGQPVPAPDDQRVACVAILASAPDILLFRHWYWLTGKPVIERRNLQTNGEYARKHYWRLKRAAQEYLNHLDNPPIL